MPARSSGISAPDLEMDTLLAQTFLGIVAEVEKSERTLPGAPDASNLFSVGGEKEWGEEPTPLLFLFQEIES